MPISSLPDFDCVIRGGRQVVIEAKAVSGRLLDMQKSKLKLSQVRYMLRQVPFCQGVPYAMHSQESVRTVC